MKAIKQFFPVTYHSIVFSSLQNYKNLETSIKFAKFFCKCVVPENIHTPTMEDFFGLSPLPHLLLSGNSNLVSYFPLKKLAFENLPIPVAGVSNDLP